MLAGKAFHRILKNTRGKLHNFKYCIFAFNYIQAQTTIFVNLFLIKLWYLSSSIQASMWTCREPRRFRSQSESMRAFFTDCRYRSTIELKEADNGRPDATGENQSLFMKTPKKGSRASTQKPPPMPSPKYDPTIKPSLITAIPTILPKSKKGPPQDFKLSTLNKIH